MNSASSIIASPRSHCADVTVAHAEWGDSSTVLETNKPGSPGCQRYALREKPAPTEAEAAALYASLAPCFQFMDDWKRRARILQILNCAAVAGGGKVRPCAVHGAGEKKCESQRRHANESVTAVVSPATPSPGGRCPRSTPVSLCTLAQLPWDTTNLFPGT